MIKRSINRKFLVPLELTSHAVAAALHVPRTRIERIARKEKPATADTALRLGKFFKTGAAFCSDNYGDSAGLHPIRNYGDSALNSGKPVVSRMVPDSELNALSP